MEVPEMCRIASLFAENKEKFAGTGMADDKVETLATIATVVDILRAEKAYPGYNGGIPIPVTVFEQRNKKIYDALNSLGCRNLIDITGWRKYMVDESCAVFDIRIHGRYERMPLNFSLLDIQEIGRTMETAGLPFEEDTETKPEVQATTFTDINMLTPESHRLYSVLVKYDCKCLEDIEGYRIALIPDGKGLRRPNFCLRIRGRFALLPEDFISMDMEQLKGVVKAHLGKELERYPDVEL